MRGEDRRSEQLFRYVNLEARIPSKHPLRRILALADEALRSLSGEFSAIYALTGRSSIPPERLLRALLLQAFYTIRSERQLMEQLEYNLLFRWFVGLSVDDPVWDVTVFTKNRDRLLEADVSKKFLQALLAQPKVKALLSEEHFSVDGTLLEAWSSMKSFVPKDGSGEAPSGEGRNAERDFHGEKRSNETHASTTDPDCRLYRKGKGKESKLCYMGHALMENRHGLVVDAMVTTATGTAEREAAVEMITAAITAEPDVTVPVATPACTTVLPTAMPPAVPEGEQPTQENTPRITLGADKGYDAAEFIEDLTSLNVDPHVAQNTKGRRSAVPDTVAARPGYATSQRIRKRIEEVFGWMKTIGGMRKLHHRGTALVGWLFTFSAAAYNLIRLSRLIPVAA